MNTHALIDAVVQQTTVFIAQLATAGGVRTPLVGVADQVFLELSRELEAQGVRKRIIADMFGMALRTYHRRVRELRSSRTVAGRTLWEVVLAVIREREPICTREIQRRFCRDDPEILTGVLNDLTGTGLVYRSGFGDAGVYRAADQADFAELDAEQRLEADRYLVWLAVYRSGPITAAGVAEATRLPADACERALAALVSQDRIHGAERGGKLAYESRQFQVPLGTSHGWEAAVLDHFQAMVAAVGAKLARGASRSDAADVIGGSTWSLDVGDGHPLQAEALGTLQRLREQVEDLRRRVDEHNNRSGQRGPRQRVVCYTGQYVVTDAGPLGGEPAAEEE